MRHVTSTNVAESTPFDNDSNGFTADNVQEAIEEVAALVGAPNFSYRVVPTSTTVTIPQYQQMSVHEEILLVGTGDLILVGDLVVFD